MGRDFFCYPSGLPVVAPLRGAVMREDVAISKSQATGVIDMAYLRHAWLRSRLFKAVLCMIL